MDIRIMTEADCPQLLALWEKTPGIGLRAGDDGEAGLRRYLLRNPGTSFVAQAQGELAGCVLCGHDGRRGYIYHLAVAPAYRRQGVARALVERALQALRAEGIAKAALVAFRDNEEGNAFWRAVGFAEREDLAYRDIFLNP